MITGKTRSSCSRIPPITNQSDRMVLRAIRVGYDDHEMWMDVAADEKAELEPAFVDQAPLLYMRCSRIVGTTAASANQRYQQDGC